ncbi:MAG: hypothetical protein P8Y43_09230, partial [Sulfurovaceae bacterium]
PDDNHNSDIISDEYRMSDGSPYQASHFREQSSPWIGLMDPAFSYGETHYPNYYTSADLNMFDAIGWDYPPCNATTIITQPQAVIVTEPESAAKIKELFEASAKKGINGFMDETYGFIDEPIYKDAIGLIAKYT